MAIAAAYAGWVLQRTIQTLKEAGATSKETAKTSKELGLDEKWLKMSANTIVSSGVFETNEGKYYFDSRRKSTLI